MTALYVLPATHAPVAVVFRRGPSAWWQLARWHLDTGVVEEGAWLHGTIHPWRRDLSPDGELLCCFVLKGSRAELLGMTGTHTYSTLSRAPWLFALAAWRESGTWTRGHHFVLGPAVEGEVEIGAPAMGDLGPLEKRRYRLVRTEPQQYANERRRGWTEHESSPRRASSDMFDERRSVALTKPSPVGDAVLLLVDQGLADDGPGRIEGRRAAFRIRRGEETLELADAAWADWDRVGRLLIATREGRLQIRDGSTGRVVHEASFAASRPAPRPAPEWATRR